MKNLKFILLKQTLVLLGITLFSSTVFGQQNDSAFLSKNTIYIDLSSRGAYYSVNYDRIFYKRNNENFSYRIGFTILEDVIALPLGVNLFVGRNNSYVEFGVTVMPYMDKYKSFLSSNDLSDKYLYIIPAIGYRFQKQNGGLFFKAGVSPMIILDPPSSNFWKMDPKVYATGNIAFGLSF